jgi:hypothetical protein
MKLITYATHSEGKFEQLINSGYPIEVIGWGTKWSGYIGKAKEVLLYLESQPETEIIVVIDGFDSLIHKNLDNLEKDFKALNCKVLYSLNDKSGFSNFIPFFVHEYFTKKIFGTCTGNQTANAGLYMGYVKELKIVLQSILETGLDDDQRAINSLCSRLPFLKVDSQNIIFENLSSENQKSDAYFISFPGTLTFNRCKRSIKEYSKYFILEIILVLVIIFVLYNVIYASSRRLRKTS